MRDNRDLYEAERARQLKAQARSRPADPQAAIGGPSALERLAEVMAPCVCGDPAAEHELDGQGRRRTWCTVATTAGPCGCKAYARAHRFGPDGTEEQCSACGVQSFLDATGPCPGKDQR